MLKILGAKQTARLLAVMPFDSWYEAKSDRKYKRLSKTSRFSSTNDEEDITYCICDHYCESKI